MKGRGYRSIVGRERDVDGDMTKGSSAGRNNEGAHTQSRVRI